MLPPKVFLDTAFALALANANDLLHARAIQLADHVEAAQTRLITTRAVLMEIGNSLAKVRYRTASIALLTSLETDPNVEIVTVTDDLYHRAFHLYQQRLDKEWGMVDCISFIVMQDHGLTAALTPDKHFQQAGYHAMLRDDTP
jgi:uncharacterized protein